jgi:hypothetical protein
MVKKHLKEQSLPLQITVYLVVFSIYKGQLCFLTIKRQEPPFVDTWALPCAIIDVQQDLTLEDSAKRRLEELMGISVPYLEQVQTRGNRFRDPRGWSLTVVYYSLTSCEQMSPKKEVGEKRWQWMSINDALAKPLAFDHQQIVEDCLQRFQNKSLYTSLPIFLLPSEFTLTEVQRTYETILGFRVEKKSFRRRLLDADCVEETGNIRRASHRPAQLYRLAHMQPYFFPRIIEGVRETKTI